MIRFLVMDVDGTLTDGKIYMGAAGEAMKAFDVKDGCGIKELLPKHSIVPVIITARTSEILQNRCRELGITELHQGERNKLECLQGILSKYGADMSHVAYIGDDILDLQCMIPVRQQGGLAGCPQDAVPQVRESSNFVSVHKAGEGAVRDFIEYIILHNEKGAADDLRQRLDKAVEYITHLDTAQVTLGRHDVSPDFYYNAMEYTPGEESEVLYESHRKYIDIQFLVSGEERLMVADISRLVPATEYDEEKDYLLYHNSDNLTGTIFRAGSCILLFPKDAHKAVRQAQSSTKVRKIVGKLLIHHD